LCQEDGKKKAYGAGLLSSFGELEYACRDYEQTDGSLDESDRPKFLPWDPEVAANQEFPITTYQPIYFVSDSLQDTKIKMRQYCENLSRPFFAMHNAQTNSVHIDRPVKRSKGIPV
jgi:phenylalanine-4-hydroxylase